MFLPGTRVSAGLFSVKTILKNGPSSGGTQGHRGNQLHVKSGLFEYGLGQQLCGRDFV